MTDIPTRALSAAARSPDAAAAESSRASRQLLDAAVARAIATLAHDVRNALGVVSMQIEAIAVRSASATPDLAAIHSHANVASEHIERLAEMTNALIAFARGLTSSDLSAIMTEAAALVPLRPVSVLMPAMAAVGIEPMLTRAVALEVLVLALASSVPPSFIVSADDSGATLRVVSGSPIHPDAELEWVVQFQKVGGCVTPTDDGLRIAFPPIV